MKGNTITKSNLPHKTDFQILLLDFLFELGHLLLVKLSWVYDLMPTKTPRLNHLFAFKKLSYLHYEFTKLLTTECHTFLLEVDISY